MKLFSTCHVSADYTIDSIYIYVGVEPNSVNSSNLRVTMFVSIDVLNNVYIDCTETVIIVTPKLYNYVIKPLVPLHISNLNNLFLSC